MEVIITGIVVGIATAIVIKATEPVRRPVAVKKK
jgi:hypothetical protein